MKTKGKLPFTARAGDTEQSQDGSRRLSDPFRVQKGS